MMRTLRNLFRLLIIAAILLRYDVLCVRKKGLRRGERLARAFERLGPTFIKLGQAISTRSDLVGDAVADDLAGLRDKLPPFPTHLARAMIEAELGAPIRDLFLDFEDMPLAAASIAQVHKAVTMSGKTVAIKVLRPNIEQAFARDVDLFAWIANLLAPRLPARLKPHAIVQTFKDTVFFELDLRFEAAACDELSANLQQHTSGMRTPTVLWELTSRRVMVSEWIEAIPFSDMTAIRASGVATEDILTKLASSLFTQIFMDGFFHADLHPGNAFLDANTGDIIAVDFGIMGRLDWDSRAYIARIVHGFLNEDYRGVAELHFAAGYVPAHKNVAAFTQACKAVAQPIMGKPIHEISVAKLLGQMFKIAAEFEMEVQPQLLLMQKSLMVAEGFGRMLNPHMNMWELARPLIEQWATEHFSKTARLKMAAEQARNHALKFPVMLKKIEHALDALGNEGGIKLHPESLRALHHARTKARRPWLILAWTTLAALIVGLAV